VSFGQWLGLIALVISLYILWSEQMQSVIPGSMLEQFQQWLLSALYLSIEEDLAVEKN
jgi:hypothetical protein